jgi:F-type H+-transporting ATPase subunit b
MTNLKTMAVPGIALALTPGALYAAEGGPGLFDVNLGLSLWTVVIFLMLVGLLGKYAWGPILSQVEAREKRIQDALDQSAASRDEASRLLDEHKAQLADARRQASEIIAEGKAAGEKVRKEVEEKARVEAQSIVEGARREIQRERDQAIAELRRESVDLALAAASKLMQERLDDERDREMVLGYLRDLSADQGAQA